MYKLTLYSTIPRADAFNFSFCTFAFSLCLFLAVSNESQKFLKFWTLLCTNTNFWLPLISNFLVGYFFCLAFVFFLSFFFSIHPMYAHTLAYIYIYSSAHRSLQIIVHIMESDSGTLPTGAPSTMTLPAFRTALTSWMICVPNCNQT